MSFAFKQDLPIVWLVGGTGKLGLAISETLQKTHNILCLSRRSKSENRDRFLHQCLDLADESSLRDSLDSMLERYFPRAIVFCQRYRPEGSTSDIDIQTALNIEILSPQKMIEETCKTTSRGPLSIVLISSVNGYLINSNMPFWYHWLKSSQMQLTKYYSACKQTAPFNMNCLTAGTFLKSPFETYPESYRDFLDMLQEMNAGRKVCTTQDMANIVEFLISDKAICINGQIITPDGGLTNRLQEGLIQKYDHQKR